MAPGGRSSSFVAVAGFTCVCRFRSGQAGLRPVSCPGLPQVLLDPKWPQAFPFKPENFERYDESSDTLFYEQPRFVAHIDDNAIKALTQ